MKAWITNGSGIENLSIETRPKPDKIGQDSVLIKVDAVALNYRDIMVAEGTYGGDKTPIIAASDMAGTVAEVGSNVSDFKPGDKVINAPFRHWLRGKLTPKAMKTFVGGNGVDGVLSEYIVYPAKALAIMPPHLSMEEGSTFTIAGLTAWAALVTHGKLGRNEWVLVHGTGGVSLFAVQLAQIIGAKTIVSTSNPEKARLLRDQFGVDATIDYTHSNWVKDVREITGGKGVYLAVETGGAQTLPGSIHACSFGGKVMIIGVMGGVETNLNIRDLISHQITLRGIYMENAKEFQKLIRVADQEQLKPHIDKTFTFDQAKQAYTHLKSQKHMGKVVIKL